MKRFLKSVTAAFLAVLARAAIHRYKPRIVMVTGSVGKTSTKDAVAAALSARFLVRKSEKSYNSEIGVPLTIFGAKNPWGNPFGWIGVIKNALALALLPNHYPNLLVLEVGADRPGDLARMLRIATPDAVVVTRLPEIPVHVEAYESPEAVREEEFSPAYGLAPGAPLIIPADDTYASAMALRTPARIISYGTTADAGARVSNIGFYEEEGKIVGMCADVSCGEEGGTLVVRGSVGATQVLPPAAAIAVAGTFGIALSDTLGALAFYEPPAGRGRLLNGKHGTTLVDDSYNSSPAAVEEALKTLKQFPHAKRRIAVLGDMLELGRYSVAEHERIGALAAKHADIVVAVGIRSRAIVTSAGEAGMSEESIMAFDDSATAAEALPELLREGDVILIKGSQSVRTERIVEALLSDIGDRSKLVRQEHEWLRR